MTRRNNDELEILFSDLTQQAQKEVLEFLGKMDIDFLTAPVAVIEKSPPEEQVVYVCVECREEFKMIEGLKLHQAFTGHRKYRTEIIEDE